MVQGLGEQVLSGTGLTLDGRYVGVSGGDLGL